VFARLLYITPREEEGVKVVVFQSACCSNFTRARREKGIEQLQKRETKRREKKKIFQKGSESV